MVVRIYTELYGEEFWKMYEDTFSGINKFAIQRHLMYRNEFDDVMRDDRVDKYTVRDEKDVLCGLATYTQHLDAMPLISPAAFEHRWPELYAQKRIFYCGFVAVSTYAPAETFRALVGQMYQRAMKANSLIFLDLCRHNSRVMRMGRVIPLLMRGHDWDVRAECVDEQEFWMYVPSTVERYLT